MEADWFEDPLGRFDGRFFDGVRWTEQVSDGGRLRTDPDWFCDAADPVVADERVAVEYVTVEPVKRSTGMLVPERREGSDRRQINTTRHGLAERREGERRLKPIVIPKL